MINYFLLIIIFQLVYGLDKMNPIQWIAFFFIGLIAAYKDLKIDKALDIYIKENKNGSNKS